jgi:aminoglycoside phosphotransferase (APT) family kinase protein
MNTDRRAGGLASGLADALAGRSGVDGVRWVIRSPAVKRVLRERVAAMAGPDVLLGPCRLRRVKFKPERRIDAHYDVVLTTPSGPRIRSVAVRWTPPGRDDATRATTVSAGPGAAGAAPFRELEAFDPGLGMRVAVWPFDPEFPQLARLSDASYVHDALVAAVAGGEPKPGHHRGATAGRLPDVTAVRYRPGERHVLRLDLPPAHGEPSTAVTLFAKLYRDGDAERAGRVATQVAEWLAAAPGGVRASGPVGRLADDDTLVYARCTGTPLSHLLGRPSPRVARSLHGAGVAVRHLQHAPGALADDLRVHRFPDELRAVGSAAEHIAALLPSAGAIVAEVLHRCEHLDRALPGETATFAHGDFKADHLWIGPTGTTLIDFDSCATADPALDVGKFLADLQWWAVALPGAVPVAAARDHFLAGYGADVPAVRLLRARLFEIVVLTKLTARRVVMYDRGWEARTERLVDRAARLLATLEQDAGVASAG